MLEWQFQKRLQESKQSEEDEEEEDDEDVDTLLIMQRLEAEKRARVRRGGGRVRVREEEQTAGNAAGTQLCFSNAVSHQPPYKNLADGGKNKTGFRDRKPPLPT